MFGNRKSLANLEAQVQRLARAAENHPSREDLHAVHQTVTRDMAAARDDISKGLKDVTDMLAGVLAQTAAAIAAPVKRTNGGTTKTASAKADQQAPVAAPTEPAKPASAGDKNS